MVKALLRVRLLSLLVSFRSRRGKSISKKALVGYGLLFLYVAVVFLALFFILADALCAPLMAAGLGWLYFALMGILATALAVVGSIFATQSQLFEARDNEMLLAMPIPPAWLLASRMVALYLQSFLMTAVVLLPTLVVYGREAAPAPAAWVFCAAALLLLPLLALALASVLGWLVALIASRMRNKSLITVVLSIGFLLAYFYLYSQMSRYLQLLLANGPAVAGVVQRALAPFYRLGLACLGGGWDFLQFALWCLAPFAVVYAVLSKTFLHIATARRGAAKVRYREKALRVSSPDRALFVREARHLWGSPMYLLNGAFGSVFLVILAVAAAIRGGEVLETLRAIPGIEPWLAPAACALVCLLASMNIVTAPSISLEGKGLWLIQSLPVTPWQVLRAKLLLHLAVTGVPSLLASAVLLVLLRPGLLMGTLLLLTPLVFADLCAALGLMLNLFMPRLDWDSEAQAVKRSGSAMISIFADWAVLLVLILLYVLTRRLWGLTAFVTAATVLLTVGAYLVTHWLQTAGARRFSALH